MTNRRELLDDALLRPGRLEVQVEISLPNKEGRREILQIHFLELRRNGCLSKPLCDAIDGSTSTNFLQKRLHGIDLATDRWTKGFSGADIAGLVRLAVSISLSRTRAGGDEIDDLVVTLSDVLQALKELKA
mmetsp:Transcript_3667/g.6262  ORF Transcript_3667/g.6262 Transcript_3667/m.6262 type:complete len:131 (+) Transcript_3667:786-1178(+)